MENELLYCEIENRAFILLFIHSFFCLLKVNFVTVFFSGTVRAGIFKFS